LRTVVPAGWAVPGYVLCAVALLALVPVLRARPGVPRPLPAGLSLASGAVQALALFSALPLLVLTLTGPLSLVSGVWAGPPGDPYGTLGAVALDRYPTAAPVVALLVAGVLTVVSRRPGVIGAGAAGPVATGRGDSGGRTGAAAPDAAPGPAAQRTGGADPRTDWSAVAGGAALALVWAALFTLPSTAGFGHGTTVVCRLLLTLGALALAIRPGWAAGHAPAAGAVALVCGLTGAVSVAFLSLATRPATFTVLGTLTVALAAAAAGSRAGAAVRAVLGCGAVVFATGLLGAVAGAASLAPHQAALVILAVPAAVALLAARLGKRPVALPLECTGGAAGLLAIGLAVGDRPTLAAVIALCGVIAAGTAVRPERRPVAYAAVVLFVLAAWVRLAAWEVAAPEAYTLPVTVPALAVGLLRRRRDPGASSWTAYGPGLAATLVPSLMAAWGDAHWPRPLLLGIAALAVTLLGARLRLMAPLVLGGGVLALDALHELAPYVVQVVDALPRWLPPALAGLVLLAVGATYEQRLRDARRLRDTLGRMR
ncbi:SCO7613 C-terminal domain-containing membrane protein, partial [Streptomyces sp. NPDC055078]